jgi:hypothetical protein
LLYRQVQTNSRSHFGFVVEVQYFSDLRRSEDVYVFIAVTARLTAEHDDLLMVYGYGGVVVTWLWNISVHDGVDPKSKWKIPLQQLQIQDFHIVEGNIIISQPSEDDHVVLDDVGGVAVSRCWWLTRRLEHLPLKSISCPV